jgi:NAD(P)H-dependent FMN reductase
MLKLHIMTVSTRKGRKGPAVARWFLDHAKAHDTFDIEPVDLAEVNLPMFDEPHHPRLQQYEHEHTKAWSAIVQRADAYIFVTPEYNFSTPPSLLNAFNYLAREWQYKPAGFVSYGGISGGLRGVQMTKQVVTTLKMMPMMETVAIPSFTQFLDKDTGAFVATDSHTRAATTLLDETHKWAVALNTMR